ncbi:Intracellular distribution of mitochondria, partial [Ascosphaera atra]
EYNNKKDLLTTFPFQNSIPNNPWMVPNANSSAPIVQHRPDVARSQENYLISGIDNAETLRDWNEEFQSTRELPRETVQDKVFRERLTSKLFADYNDAAARGAVLVARGEIAPLNPTEGKDAQIFVYNNIFFSYGADGVGTFASEGGDEAARVAVGKDVAGVRAVNQLDIPGLFTPGTVVVDYMGKRIVAQSIVPGIFKQREPGEHQIDYGGVEGKEVVAEHPEFGPVFEKLSSALRVKKHPVWDKDGKRHDLEGSVETKGLMGTDGRKYVLDLYRITPLDVAWTDGAEGHPEYPHKMAVLRLELIDAYWRHKMADYVKAEVDKKRAVLAEKKEKKEAESKENKENKEAKEGEEAEKKEEDDEDERVDISNFKLALNPDVFSGQVPQTDEEKAAWAEDEKEVRAACDFLLTKVLPEVIQDLHDGEVGFPMDGQSLTQLLHKRGINVRYLGKIAELSDEKGPRLVALKALVIQEMITRAFKHIANKYLHFVPVPLTSAAIAHLLNCLLGTGLESEPKAEVDADLKAIYPEGDYSFESVTPASLKAEIEQNVAVRYRFTLPAEWTSELKHLQVLRSIALKLGLQLGERKYIFDKSAIKTEVPAANKASDEEAPAAASPPVGSSKKNKKKNKVVVMPCMSWSTNPVRHPCCPNCSNPCSLSLSLLLMERLVNHGGCVQDSEGLDNFHLPYEYEREQGHEHIQMNSHSHIIEPVIHRSPERREAQ